MNAAVHSGLGRASPDDVQRFLRLLHRPGDVFELRGLSKSRSTPIVTSGYFDDMTALAAAAIERSGKDDGVYITLNPVNPALLARAPANRVRQAGNGDTTSDRDVQHRRHLLIDVDPIRPTGISSTDVEHASALELAGTIAEHMGKLGWPEPIRADSGNGGHLIYAIDLPVDDGSLVKRVLAQLSKRFTTPAIKVDERVFNPARISKIYGTLTRKGENTADRPHRLARLLVSPATVAEVTREQLEAYASTGERDVKPTKANSTPREHTFDIDGWIAQHIPDALQQPWSEGRKWLLPVCPFNSDHARREAYITEKHSGMLAAGCHHESCFKSWKELRLHFEPERANGSGNTRLTDRLPPPEVIYDADVERIKATVEPPKPRWYRCPDLVGVILERANEQWIALKLGADVLVLVRPGGIAVLMGPTGAGKTSLAICMLIAHIEAGGVVIVLSRELPGDELAARLIGVQCDESWSGVLTGRVLQADMLRVTSERMLVLDREHATLDELNAAIKGARTEYPDAPILAAIDYLQILESEERDARAKVSDVVARIDNIARVHRVAVLALSQMSRASSRAARNGEAMGADSTDGGAESAAIERAASVTLAIGAAGEEREDGTRAVDLSVGKSRMLGGDRVHPASYCGRTGRWRLAGEARAAAEVRAEREGQRDRAKQHAAELAIVAAAERASEPQLREDLAKLAACAKDIRRAAMSAVLARGELVEVQSRNPRSRSWKVWTPARAAAAGVPLAGSGDQS